MVIEIRYIKSKYVEFPYIFFFNVENRLCGLESERVQKILRIAGLDVGKNLRPQLTQMKSGI